MHEAIIENGLRSEGARALARFLLDGMARGELREGMRLPTERTLSERFGASRGTVRRVLAGLRQRGLIEQTVGSGTFVTAGAHALAPADTAGPALHTSPAELMEARLLIEPLMPALIVRNATGADFAAMADCLQQGEAARTIDEFEHWDGELHKAFATATHNRFFLQILELSNRVREQGDWGRLKRNSLTPARRAQYETQHRDIVAALKDRDETQARELMRRHLAQIRQNLFGD